MWGGGRPWRGWLILSRKPARDSKAIGHTSDGSFQFPCHATGFGRLSGAIFSSRQSGDAGASRGWLDRSSEIFVPCAGRQKTSRARTIRYRLSASHAILVEVAMTRFFFDLQDDGGVLRDGLGAEFTSLGGAELHAKQIAFDVARDLAAQNRRVRIFVRAGSIN